ASRPTGGPAAARAAGDSRWGGEAGPSTVGWTSSGAATVLPRLSSSASAPASTSSPPVPGPGPSESTRSHTMIASPRRCAARSNQTRARGRAPGSTREGIDDDVDGDLRGVLRLPAVPVLRELHVPLGAVVLVAVEHVDPVPVHDPHQVIVHQVVAPAVELVARRRGTVLELEERPVQPVVVRDLHQLPEQLLELLRHRLVEDAVDVVVVVIDEDEASPPHVLLQVRPLPGREEYGEVPRDEEERVLEELVRVDADVDALRVQLERRVLGQDVDDVLRDERSALPVARGVDPGGEGERLAPHGEPSQLERFPCVSTWRSRRRRTATSPALATSPRCIASMTCPSASETSRACVSEAAKTSRRESLAAAASSSSSAMARFSRSSRSFRASAGRSRGSRGPTFARSRPVSRTCSTSTGVVVRRPRSQ